MGFRLTTLSYSIGMGAGALLYTNYFYHNYIVGAFHQFPEPVAKQMRKAIYFTNISLEPKMAIKYYLEALRVAEEIGMDPFSNEIIGVKVQLAALLEKVHNYQRAIEVLEMVKSDNLKWMEIRGNREGKEAQRTRVLMYTIRVSVKLGELYAGQHVLKKEKAEEALVWAVTTMLKEHERREKEGVKPEEGDWVSLEEQGAALECMYGCAIDEVSRLTHSSTCSPLRGGKYPLLGGSFILTSHCIITTEDLPYSCP
jgi:hypothetical protein